MKRLIAFALLLSTTAFVSSCATKPASVEVFGSGGLWTLPRDKNRVECQGNDTRYWNECWGWEMTSFGGKTLLVKTGFWLSGKLFGKRHYFHYDGIKNLVRVCEFIPTSSGEEKTGWEICRPKEYSSVILSRQFLFNGQVRNDLIPQIELAEQKNECRTLGFKDDTPEMGNCILQIRQMQQQRQTTNNPRPRQPQRSSSDLSDAEKLLRFGAILSGAVNAEGGGASSSASTGVACLKTGETRSGMSKVCLYSCGGNAKSLNVGAAEICPLAPEL